MSKVKISNDAYVYPMPMVLVGAVVEGRVNFMAVGWVARVNYQPPMIAIALGGGHHTNAGIHEHKAFSVNMPGMDLIERVDYCGLASGKTTDKSQLFEVFYGEVPHAPMIRECPLTMECRLFEAVNLPSNTLFVGEIVAAHCDERFLTDGKPDVKKMSPFVLTMPDNNYWILGEQVGKAWHAGKSFRP